MSVQVDLTGRRVLIRELGCSVEKRKPMSVHVDLTGRRVLIRELGRSVEKGNR